MTTDDDSTDDPRLAQRFATRVSGAEWSASVKGLEDPVTVRKLSRIGLEVETTTSLVPGARYMITLTHEGESTETVFYVLRCAREDGDPGRFRAAGLFVETLSRQDLPEIIPDSPPRP